MSDRNLCLKAVWYRYILWSSDEISQSMVELSLLPVSENKRPQYWNFTSCLQFHHIGLHHFGMLLFTVLPSFIDIWRFTPKLLAFIENPTWHVACVDGKPVANRIVLELYWSFGGDRLWQSCSNWLKNIMDDRISFDMGLQESSDAA